MSGKRRSSAEWGQLLAEFEVGTESASEFCRGRGISSSNFCKRRMTRTHASSSVFVMADAYEDYNGVCAPNQLVRLGCWAHARRKLVAAQRQQAKGKTTAADLAAPWIGKLYLIERAASDPADTIFCPRWLSGSASISGSGGSIVSKESGDPSAVGKVLDRHYVSWPRIRDLKTTVSSWRLLCHPGWRYLATVRDLIRASLEVGGSSCGLLHAAA